MSLSFWIWFHVVIFIFLIFDLSLSSKQKTEQTLKTSLLWSAFWIAPAICFNLYIYINQGSDAGLQFFTAYLVEKSLSIDNLFIFLVIFSQFKLNESETKKVLFYGIFGAIILRASLIFAGLALIQSFSWVFYIFGALLIYTALKMIQDSKPQDIQNNYFVKYLQKILPSKNPSLSKFLLVVIIVEFTDLIFALDSVPAIIAITQDPFLIYTSNIFAILGLRALFFVLRYFAERLHYLKYSIMGILIFVGIKMLLLNHYHIPILLSLSVIATFFFIGIFASLYMTKIKKPSIVKI